MRELEEVPAVRSSVSATARAEVATLPDALTAAVLPAARHRDSAPPPPSGGRSWSSTSVLGLQRLAGNLAVTSRLGGARPTRPPHPPASLAPRAVGVAESPTVQRACPACEAAGEEQACASGACVQRETPDAGATKDAGAARDAGADAAGADAGLTAPPGPPQDIVILLGGDQFQKNEAAAVTARTKGKRINALSEADLISGISGITQQIGTVYIVGHTLSNGNFIIGDDLTTSPQVSAATLAPKIAAAMPAGNKAKSVQYLSCSVGQAPKELDRVRKAFGAGEATAPTCFRVVHTVGPITLSPPKIGKTVITSQADLDALEAKAPGAKKHFDASFTKLLAKLGTEVGCVEGAPTGSTAAANRADLLNLYFAGGGQLVTAWMSETDLHAPFKAGTTPCFKDLPVVDAKNYTPGSGCVLVKAS